MVILIIFMFVLAILAAILDLQPSFAIEISLLELFGWQNMLASTHKSAFRCELNNEFMSISVFSMSFLAILADILDLHTYYAIETYSLDD